MKKLIAILALGITMVSCDESRMKKDMPIPKYELGDIVHLKMDSAEVMVIGIYTLHRDIPLYKVKHRVGNLEYKRFDVHEFELIELNKSNSIYEGY